MKFDRYQPEALIRGDSDEDTQYLKAMAAEARSYIISHSWCPPIKDVFLAYGIGKVVAVFLIRFTQPIADKDDALWVVVGDIPSAYLVTDALNGPRDALATYCDLMDDWVRAVLNDKDLSQVFPIKAEATAENARALSARINFLRERVIPNMPPDQM